MCVYPPAPHHPGLYQRLCFDLLASSWLPRPLGIVLWSTLHVMLLIIGRPTLWVLSVLTTFFYYSLAFVFGVISLYVIFALAGLYSVVLDSAFLLVESIRFCWWLVRFLACHEPIVEWRGAFCVTVEFWEGCKDQMSNDLGECVQFCTSGSSYVYKETKDRHLKTWARRCGEVVHKHDVIAL